MKYIHVSEANCKNCYKCLKVCPVKSIRYSDNHVEVLDEACVLCGRCIRNCPQKAKSLINDLSPVKALLADTSKIKAAALAPSYLASFGIENRLKVSAALRKLGFDHVEETAAGAHEVSREYARILQSGTMDVMISTCCSTTVFLVQKYFPDLTKYLAPVLSPMETHGLMMKRALGENARVVFFGPCISKIEEARTEPGRHVDHVVTFKQLSQWLQEAHINLGELQDAPLDNTPTASSIYPVFEGVTDDVKRMLPEDSPILDHYDFISVQGTKDLIEMLQELQNGRIHHCFIEASACYGSCINGPEKGDEGYRPVSLNLETRRFVQKLKHAQEPLTSKLDLTRVIAPQPLHEEIPDEATIRSILAQIGKTSPEQELNCGSCGYRTCRDKAIAVYQKKAELYMCMPYMSTISETLSNVTLSLSPNYIIAVDRGLIIRECNLAAQQLFRHTRKQLIGQKLQDWLPPSEFARAIANKENQPSRKVRYDDLGIIVNQTIVYNADQDIAVGFLQDITKAEREAEALNRMKLDTMEMAQNVINKQMTVAQEIASLLGETTAETKVTLTKLKDLIIYEGQEKENEQSLH